MKTPLKLTSSIFGGNGASSRRTEAFVARWLAKPGERTAAQQTAVNASDTLIDELRRADVLVLGLPMYNFGVPSTLKAYFDYIGRAGETFRYTENTNTSRLVA